MAMTANMSACLAALRAAGVTNTRADIRVRADGQGRPLQATMIVCRQPGVTTQQLLGAFTPEELARLAEAVVVAGVLFIFKLEGEACVHFDAFCEAFRSNGHPVAEIPQQGVGLYTRCATVPSLSVAAVSGNSVALRALAGAPAR